MIEVIGGSKLNYLYVVDNNVRKWVDLPIVNREIKIYYQFSRWNYRKFRKPLLIAMRLIDVRGGN